MRCLVRFLEESVGGGVVGVVEGEDRSWVGGMLS